MKEVKRNRIQRHRVPNLIQLAETYKNKNVSPPLFFSKIENSLKLLQGPLYENLQPKKVKKIIDKNILSLRMTQLARHKQHPFICYKSARLKSKESNERPISLPRMQTKSQYYTISQGELTEISETLHNRTTRIPSSNEIQSITSNDLKSRSFEIIWKELEAKKQEQRRRRQQKFMQQLEQQQKQEEKRNQMELTQPKLELKVQKLTEFSQDIVKGQQNIYQTYQKKLLQKIKLYRPKRLKFVHQTMWK